MIFLYIFFLLVGIVAFLLTAKFSLFIRCCIAFAVFVAPSAAITLLVMKVGDRPPPDAITVLPNEAEDLQKEVGKEMGKN